MTRRRLPLLALVLLAAGCDVFDSSPGGRYVAGGDASRGLALLSTGAHGCQGCHAIPGIRAPKGVAGPPLEGMARRSFIAGQLPNKQGVMIAFLRNPPALVPATGMPDVGLTEEEARHIAAYLYTLEPPDAS